MTSPKSREDYLIGYHKGLHAALLVAYQALNRNFLFVYGTAVIIVAVDLGLVTEVSGSGIKLQAGDGLLYFLAALVALIYLLINFQILRIAELFREIVDNAGQLAALNAQARVVTINDVLLFTTGITGLILSLAKWQANQLARRNPIGEISTVISAGLGRLPLALFYFFRTLISWLTNLLVRGGIVLSLFFFPILVFEYFLLAKLAMTWEIAGGIVLPQPDVAFSLFGILTLVSLSTAVCGLKLFFSFFVELIAELLDELREQVDSAAVVAKARMVELALGLARLLLNKILP